MEQNLTTPTENLEEVVESWFDVQWEDTTETLEEAVEPKACYVIKVWDNPESKKSGSPSFDSAAEGITYADFDDVLAALRSTDLSDKGAYEITWIKS